MRPLMRSVRAMLEGCLDKCGGPNCQRTKQENGSDLMQCARLAAFPPSFLSIVSSRLMMNTDASQPFM